MPFGTYGYRVRRPYGGSGVAVQEPRPAAPQRRAFVPQGPVNPHPAYAPTTQPGSAARAQENYNVYSAISQQPTTYGRTPFTGYTQNEANVLNRQMQHDRSSDPLMGMPSYDRFRMGGAFGMDRQQQQPQSAMLQYPQSGTRLSGGTTLATTPWGTSQGAVAPQFLPGGNAPSDMPILTANQQRATTAIGQSQGQYGPGFAADRVVPREQNQGRATGLPGLPSQVANAMTPEQRQGVLQEGVNTRRQHFGLPSVSGMGGQQGPNMEGIRMPPSMLGDQSAEGAPTRQAQVVDFLRSNPNATLEQALQAGFTREDFEAAQAELQAPQYGQFVGPAIASGGIIPQPLMEWAGQFGVGPYSPTARTQRDQRKRDRDRIGGLLGP